MGLLNSLAGGGKKSQQSSSNRAYDTLSNAYGGQINQGTQAVDLVSSLLGGGPEGDAAYKAYQNSTGFQNILDSGSRAITGNAASRGLLRSGGTGKALMSFGQDAAKSNFNAYLQQLLGLSDQGLRAGAILSDAGRVSSGSSGGGKSGLGKLLGAGLSFIPGAGAVAGAFG